MFDHTDFIPSKLGEISRPRQWPTISQEVIRETGSYPVYGANGVIGFYESYTHEKSTVAITCRGSTCGEVHLTPGMSYITGNAMALDDLDTSRLDQRYLYHFLKRDGLKDCITGSAQPQIIGSALKDFLVWHPPLENQRLIARILDTLDTQIHKTEALIAKLEKVKEGLLHDLLTRGIDENGQLRPSPEQAPELYKKSPLGLIPREWEIKQLKDLSSTGMVNGVFKEVSRAGTGTALVNVADLYRGDEIKLENCEKFDANDVEKVKYDAASGDVFFTRSSLKLEGIAHCNWLKSIDSPAVFECHVIRIRPSSEADSRFLVAWCRSNYARLHFMGNAKQVTMTTISQDGIGSLPCPVPPIDEQKEISERILSLEKRVADENLNLNKLSNQKQALMDDLLTGRVRVTPLLDQTQATTPA